MIKMVVFALMLGLFFACAVKDTTLPKTQKVIVYTDCVLKSDEVIFRKFKKEHHIEVFIKPVSADTLLRFLNLKRQQANVDLFLLKDFSLMQELSNEQVLFPVHSVKLNSKLDYIYRSHFGKWFALGKTPLVFVYNSLYLKSDTISRYSQLINKEWEDRLALQNNKSSTMNCFVEGIQYDYKNRSGEFLSNLWKQEKGELLKNDIEVLEMVNRNEANLGMVQLASFLSFSKQLKASNDSLKSKLRIIIPNQRNRGAYQTISSMGMYRFARNPIQAKVLMEFLLSRSAQYQYAKNRDEYPILNDISPSYELLQISKYKGRFVNKNYHQKNK